jgi:exonuclease SbcD
LKRLSGDLEDILSHPEWAEFEGHYLQVTLTDQVRPRHAMERLRARFPHVLVLTFDPQGAGGDTSSSYASRLRGRSDLDVAADFVTHVRSFPAAGETMLLQSAFAEVRRDEVSV